MVKSRSLHRLLGILMLLPFIGWSLTGAIFFLKPGYAGAYDIPQVKTYPLTEQTKIKADPAWLEMRLLKTVLGEHLLVRNAEGWQHLDPVTRQLKAPPTDDEMRQLLSEALQTNPERYGNIASINGNTATTNTGVRVTLNWQRLTLTQTGKDTDRIDMLYKIHYLQWTGIPGIDKVLGAVGIAFILLLSFLGVRLFFSRR
jgi:hypothetical protein